MKNTQISVFLKNSKGTLYALCDLLGKNGINIHAVSISENLEFGAARIIVNKPGETLQILKENGFVANTTDVIIVETEDKPGSLAAILKALFENSINIDYMYGFSQKTDKKGIMVFRFDNTEKATEILLKNKTKILSNKEIGDF